MLVGININESWLNEAASILSYKMGRVHFMYLGLSIGGNVRRLVFWELVLSRTKTRLSSWKSTNLSLVVAWFSLSLPYLLFMSMFFASSKLHQVLSPLLNLF